MKRFLAALLCVPLLLCLLPVVCPCARMITQAGVFVSPYITKVMSPITWRVYGEDGWGTYEYQYDMGARQNCEIRRKPGWHLDGDPLVL